MTSGLRATAALTVAACLLAACSSGAASPSVSSAAPATPTPAAPASAASSPATSATASEPAASVAASPIEVKKVSLQLDFTISGSSGGLLWGIDKGYFKDAGIDLDVIPGRGSDLALNQIDSGNVDFAMLDGSNYVAARAENVTKTTALYAFQNISTTAIASKVQINDPKDMVGKSFGTVAQSSGRTKIPLVLKNNGVDPKSVQIELMDFSVLYPTLFEGKIDTAEVGVPGSWEGAYIAAQKQGLTLYVKLISDWGYRDYSKLLIASDKVISENPDLVKRMVAAIDKSQNDAIANATGDEIYELVKKVDPQVEEDAAKLTWEDVQKYIKNPGPMDDATFQFQLQQLEKPSTMNPSELYTNDYIPAG
jgi:NitT/TauT family transport system substrate-binding protein